MKDFDILDTTAYPHVFARYNSLLPAMIGDQALGDVFLPVAGLSANHGNCKEVKLATTLRYSSPDKAEGYFTFTYTAPYTGNYYFYPKAAGVPESVKIRIGSEEKLSFLERDTDHVLSIGHFEEGSEIKLTFYIPKNDSINFYTKQTFLWYFDNSAYESSMQKMLALPQFKIDSQSSDDHLFGSIKTESDSQMIMTTIPYDKGWNVYVDGEKVEIYETLDALVAFDIEAAGEHSLEFKYMPKIYNIGLIISIIGIIAFVLICAADFVLKKTIFKNRNVRYLSDFWVLEDFENEDNCNELHCSPTIKKDDEYHTEDK